MTQTFTLTITAFGIGKEIINFDAKTSKEAIKDARDYVAMKYEGYTGVFNLKNSRCNLYDCAF